MSLITGVFFLLFARALKALVLLLAVVFPAYLPRSALCMFETVVFLPPILFLWLDEQLLFWLFALI